MIKLDLHKKLMTGHGLMDLHLKAELQKGTLINLYGSSGAGKTSVLRMLAGLMAPDEGVIIVQDQTWFDVTQSINLSPQNRKVGLVFQTYALFPNMTVEENLSYALLKNQDKKIIDELIELIELGELRSRKPDTLSGGQQQRVALARALVQKPDLLLLDEPLSALDHEMRIRLQDYILEVHTQYELTTILVSHDVSEIMKMSDLMIELDAGKVINQGTPANVLADQKLSGKFQFTGKIISMDKQEFIFILSILIGRDIVKVVADENEATALKVGDQVLVASKAFNPVIKKIN